MSKPSQQDLNQIRQMIFSGMSTNSSEKSSMENLSLKPKDLSKHTSSSMANLSSAMNQYSIGAQKNIKKSTSRVGSRVASRVASPAGSKNGSRNNLYNESSRQQTNFLEVSLPASAFRKLTNASTGANVTSKSLRGSKMNLASVVPSPAGSSVNLAETRRASAIVAIDVSRRGSNAPSLSSSLNSSWRGSISATSFSLAVSKSLTGLTVPFDKGHVEVLTTFASHVRNIKPEHFVSLSSKGTHGFEEITAVISNPEYPAHNDDRVFRVKKITKDDAMKSKYLNKLHLLKDKAREIQYVFCSSLLAILQDAKYLYFVSDCHTMTLQEVLNNNTVSVISLQAS